jgi:molybdopterin-guanine dinucleotide biosynthesis protein A
LYSCIKDKFLINYKKAVEMSVHYGIKGMKALILSGGENKRLPVIKGLLEIEGRRIIDLTAELLRGIFDCVIISTNKPEVYFYLGAPMVGDVVQHRGPMTGILSVFMTFEASALFVTACDMPFIKPELVRYITDKWIQDTANLSIITRHSPRRKRWDAAIPIFDKKPQPLLGIYSKRTAAKMEEAIKSGNRSLRKFLEKLDVLYIDEKEVKAIDPKGRSFVNINTLEDYKKLMSSEQ